MMNKLAGLVAVLGLFLMTAGVEVQAYTIRNGSAPPDPDNVLPWIKVPTVWSFDVQDFGTCDGQAWCSQYVKSTTVELASESLGYAAFSISVFDTSQLLITGGSASLVYLYDEAKLDQHAGSVDLLYGRDDALATLHFGQISEAHFRGGGADNAQLIQHGGYIGHLTSSGTFTLLGGETYEVINRDGTVDIDGGHVVDLHIAGSVQMSLLSGDVDSALLEGLSNTLVDGATSNLTLSSIDHASVLTLSNGRIQGPFALNRASLVVASGGEIEGDVTANAYSTLEIAGGSLTGTIEATDESWVVVTGGIPGDLIVSKDQAWVRVRGSDFAIDGTPVGLGDVTAPRGRLTGTLEDGSSLDVLFHQGNDVEPTLLCDPCGGSLTLEAPNAIGGTP